MLRILHFSDLHLDTTFIADGLPPQVAAFRRADIRATLGRILSLARELKVDIVTIAGDLYEHDHFTLDTADFLISQFKRLAPVQIFISPGAHDPYVELSLYALTKWPENVTIFSRNQLSNVRLTTDVQLWGAACPPMPKYTLRNIGTLDQTKVNLLLLHAHMSVPHQAEKTSSFSVTPEELAEVGIRCALLGGEHTTKLDRAFGSDLLYPGSPEPLEPGNSSEQHSVLLISIDGTSVFHEVIPINHWHYSDLVVDVTGCATEGEIVQRIRRNMPTELDSSAYTVCRVALTGTPDLEISLDSLHSHFDSRSFLKFELRLAFPYDLDRLKYEQTVRGVLVRRYLERTDSAADVGQHILAERSLYVALNALEGKRVNLDEIA
jgi:DNA repair exonuclease SbcCD nuclease subunit